METEKNHVEKDQLQNGIHKPTNNGYSNTKPEHTKEEYLWQKIFLSVCMILAFFVLGATFNLLGPSLVHLGYLYGASITAMSFTFTWFSLGYLIGSILSGTVFDRFNREIQFFLTCMLIGLSTILVTWIPTIYGFYAGVLVMSTVMGYCDACGQPYSIRLWAGNKFKGPIVQMLYAIWTIGTFVGPLIVGPFLAELPNDESNNTTYCDQGYNATTDLNSINLNDNGNSTQNCSIKTSSNISNTDGEYIVPEGMEKVRYGYLVAGVIMCIVSTTFVVAFYFTRNIKLIEDPATKDDDKSEEKKKDNVKSDDRFFKIVLLLLMFFFAIFLMCSVGIMSGLVSTFVIKGLNWSVDKGPLISSTFSGAQALARLLAIPLSAFIPPVVMLTFDVLLAVVAAVMMTFVGGVSHPALMWISTGLAGFGLGTTFPAAMLWTSSFMPMTGMVGSIFFIGGSLGIMGSTALAGYLFENYDHMWVPYLTLLACLIDLMLFICTFIFVKCYHRRRDQNLELATINVNGIDAKELMPLNHTQTKA